MYIRKINYLWVINLVIFVAVVFLGIEQAGRGAEISKLEDKLLTVSEEKRVLSENIFNNGDETKLTNVADSGFVKPSKVYYFNSIDSVASIK